LEQLITFESVHRLSSFSSAAQERFRAKSAISHSIKALEEAFNVSLFDRSTRHVDLTVEGEVLLSKAKDVLIAARLLEQAAQELSDGYEATLTLLLDGAAPVGSVMRAVQRISSEYPSVRINVVVEHLNRVAKRFELERCEMMVTFGFLPQDGVLSVDLSPIESVLVAHKNHPLVTLQGELSRSDLTGYIELIVAGCAQDPLSVQHQLRFNSPHIFEVSDFNLKRHAILGGIGYGWLPAHLIEENLKSGELVMLLLKEGSKRMLSPQLVYRLDPPLGKIGKRLLSYLKDEISKKHSLA